MATDEIIEMMDEAAMLGVTFRFVGDGLRVTQPPTAEAAAILQRMAPHKEEIKALLLQPVTEERLTQITAVGCTVSEADLATLQSQAAAMGRELHTEADGDGWYILRNVPIGANLWRGFVVHN